jgi:hypothetical protein
LGDVPSPCANTTERYSTDLVTLRSCRPSIDRIVQLYSARRTLAFIPAIFASGAMDRQDLILGLSAALLRHFGSAFMDAENGKYSHLLFGMSGSDSIEPRIME